jgi:hypothetical protein
MVKSMFDYLGEGKHPSYYHFLEPLRQAGYKLSQEKAGKQISVLAQKNEYLSEIVQDEMLIRLLSNAQIRKGKSYSYRELLQIATSSIFHLNSLSHFGLIPFGLKLSRMEGFQSC